MREHPIISPLCMSKTLIAEHELNTQSYGSLKLKDITINNFYFTLMTGEPHLGNRTT